MLRFSLRARTITTGLAQRQLRAIGTLVFAEHEDGKLLPATASAVTAAVQLKEGPVTALVTGSASASVAAEAAKLAGLDRVLTANGQQYDRNLPEELAPLVVETLRALDATSFVAANSAVGKNLSPRVAALLDVMQISDIIGVEGDNTFARPVYAGNAIATVKTSDPLKIITVRPTAFAPAGEADPVPIEEAPVSLNESGRVRWVKAELVKSERPDLGTASRVVSGGRGLKNRETFQALMYPLADALGAAVGASRAAVDSGFADNSLQVGQTGKVVAPDFYLAVGISGAIQHLAGMKDSKIIACINKGRQSPVSAAD